MIQEYSSKFFPTVLGIRKPRHATHRTTLSGGDLVNWAWFSWFFTLDHRLMWFYLLTCMKFKYLLGYRLHLLILPLISKSAKTIWSQAQTSCFFGFCCRMMRAAVSMDEASHLGLKDKKHPLENLAGVLFTFEIFTCSVLTSHKFPACWKKSQKLISKGVCKSLFRRI